MHVDGGMEEGASPKTGLVRATNGQEAVAGSKCSLIHCSLIHIV